MVEWQILQYSVLKIIDLKPVRLFVLFKQVGCVPSEPYLLPV